MNGLNIIFIQIYHVRTFMLQYIPSFNALNSGHSDNRSKIEDNVNIVHMQYRSKNICSRHKRCSALRLYFNIFHNYV